MTQDNTTPITASTIAYGLMEWVPALPRLMSGLFNLIFAKPNKKHSIGLLFEQIASQHPERPFLHFGSETWTYQVFNQKINQYAHAFKELGVQQGDVVGIMGENDPEVLLCAIACHKLGAIASMLNYNQRDEVLTHSLSIAYCKLIIAIGETYKAINDIYAQLAQKPAALLFASSTHQHQTCPPNYQDLAQISQQLSTQNLPETANIVLSTPAFYIFTSGTTGMPKASIMTHYRWRRCMAGMGQATLRLYPNDILYCSLPLYHNNALTVSLSAVLGAGASLALSPKFSVSNFWKEIQHFKATSFSYIGELCRYLLNRPPSSDDQHHHIRVIVGNGLRTDIWMEFKKRFNIKHIAEFYGASEGNLLFLNLLNQNCTAGLCPLSYKIVQYDTERDEVIRDSNGHFITLENPGDIGLLINEVTTRSPFEGYTDKKASEKKLLHDGFKKGDCWFNTGDLVKRMPFKHIQFADRIGDTYRWKGENVATTEVESVLQHYPAIEHAVVYGVEIPKMDGKAGMATITPVQGESINIEQLGNYLHEKMPKYEIPVFLRISSQIETTSTFKSRKVELKHQGFNLEHCGQDKLYILLPDQKTYQILTSETIDKIHTGSLRL